MGVLFTFEYGIIGACFGILVFFLLRALWPMGTKFLNTSRMVVALLLVALVIELGAMPVQLPSSSCAAP